MSDLSDKTITIPADLSTLSGTGGAISPAQLRRNANYNDENAGCELPSSRFQRNLADEIERQHPPRMDEPDYGHHVLSGEYELVRTADPSCGRPVEWVDIGTGCRLAWDDIENPRPVGGAS